MPDKDGKLSQADKDKIVDWLKPRMGDRPCAVCGHNNWVLGEHLLHTMAYHGGNLVVGGVNYPKFFIVCENCYHVVEFMAVPLGLAERDDKDGDKDG